MKKKAWSSLIISIIVCSGTLSMGNFSQNFETNNTNDSLDILSSDSWSRIVNQDGRLYIWHCELVNESLYIIGVLELRDSLQKYLYISKFSPTGSKEWELTIETESLSQLTCGFDTESNLFILCRKYYSNYISLFKLNSSGTILFSRNFNISGSYPYYSRLVLSQDNTLLIVCQFENPPNGASLLLMKLNNAGQSLWSKSFIVDSYSSYYSIVKGFRNNTYVFFTNHSNYHLAKINGSGVIEWKKGFEHPNLNLMIDNNENIYIIGEREWDISYILKLNSSGNQIRETLIEDYEYYYVTSWYFDELLIYNEYSMILSCYDLDLNLKWNSSLSDYLSYYFGVRIFLSKDYGDNFYIAQKSREENVDLVKISSTGVFLSKVIWGQGVVVTINSLNIDLENNLYITCSCEYYNVWNDQFSYAVVIKNPVDGGIPPKPKLVLDERDFFLIVVISLSCIFSLTALVSMRKRYKKRIS